MCVCVCVWRGGGGRGGGGTNYYIINYYIDHRLPVCRQWHAMYTAFKFITNRLILHKVHKIKLHVHTVIYMIISPTCSTSASREQHNKASRYIL